MLDTIVSIILFIVAFGLLICIHEAGHLSMAKLFKVYCKEYSIGFGPAIYSKKRKGHETKFSIRCIPFGGYVSMYGEGMEDDPEFKDIPKERSLEGIKKWKKAIVLAAGVILNALLAFVLIFISNVAFPTVSFTRETVVTSQTLIDKGIKSGDELQFYFPSSYEDEGSIRPFTYDFEDNEKLIHAGNFFIVDTDVTLEGPKHLVMGYLPVGNKTEPNFSEGIILFEAIHRNDLESTLVYDTKLKQDLIEWSKTEGSPDYYPNFEVSTYTSESDFDFEAHLTFDGQETFKTVQIHAVSSKKGNKVINTYDDIGLSFRRAEDYQTFGESIKNTFIDYGNAASAVFRGLKVLFTGGIRNMSGIIGIFDASASLYTNYTFATYLYFWGLISVNLAIFNLLPFPGLDGWQLLVTAIEGITRKKIPQKLKGIMSLIGLILLFGLMIAIIVLDVLRIIGI